MMEGQRGSGARLIVVVRLRFQLRDQNFFVELELQAEGSSGSALELTELGKAARGSVRSIYYLY